MAATLYNQAIADTVNLIDGLTATIEHYELGLGPQVLVRRDRDPADTAHLVIGDGPEGDYLTFEWHDDTSSFDLYIASGVFTRDATARLYGPGDTHASFERVAITIDTYLSDPDARTQVNNAVTELATAFRDNTPEKAGSIDHTFVDLGRPTAGGQTAPLLIVTVPPGREGDAYTLTLHDGTERTVTSAEDAYRTLANLIDELFSGEHA